MLTIQSYPKAFIDAAQQAIMHQLALYNDVIAGVDEVEEDTLQDFENEFCCNIVLALEHYFVHRMVSKEGKDGNPLNEVRMLADSIMNNQGIFTDKATVTYNAPASVLGITPGQQIRLSYSDIARLQSAFFKELRERYQEA